MTKSIALSACEWIFAGRRPIAEIARLLVDAGYDAVEIAGEPGRADRHALASAVGQLSVSGTTAMGRWPTDERDLSHPERDARLRAVGYYKRCVDLAAELGAPTVGVVPTGAGRLEAITDYRKEWRFAAEGLREIAIYAGERDVRAAVEAINRYETCLVNRVDQALELISEVDVDGLGLIADTFHMQIEELDPVAAVASAGDRLLALHLADSTRLGLGRGCLDVVPIVSSALAAGFQGPVVVECTAQGPGPFRPDKGAAAMAMLDVYLAESAAVVRAIPIQGALK